MIREAQHDVMRWYACGSLLSDVTEWTLGCLRPNMGMLVSFSKRCWTLLSCYQYFYFNTYDQKHCHYTLGLPCRLFCWRIWKSKLRKAVSNNLKLCTHVCPKHFHWRKYSEYSKEVKSKNCVQCTYVCPKHFWPCKYSDRGDGQDGNEEDFMESNICPPLTPRTPQAKPVETYLPLKHQDLLSVQYILAGYTWPFLFLCLVRSYAYLCVLFVFQVSGPDKDFCLFIFVVLSICVCFGYLVLVAMYQRWKNNSGLSFLCFLWFWFCLFGFGCGDRSRCQRRKILFLLLSLWFLSFFVFVSLVLVAVFEVS